MLVYLYVCVLPQCVGMFYVPSLFSSLRYQIKTCFASGSVHNSFRWLQYLKVFNWYQTNNKDEVLVTTTGWMKLEINTITK